MPFFSPYCIYWLWLFKTFFALNISLPLLHVTALCMLHFEPAFIFVCFVQLLYLLASFSFLLFLHFCLLYLFASFVYLIQFAFIYTYVSVSFQLNKGSINYSLDSTSFCVYKKQIVLKYENLYKQQNHGLPWFEHLFNDTQKRIKIQF